MTSWIEFFALMTDDISRLDEWWFKTILSDMNILYRHIRPKKGEIPNTRNTDDFEEKKSGTDWVLPKIIGLGRVSSTLGTESGNFQVYWV